MQDPLSKKDVCYMAIFPPAPYLNGLGYVNGQLFPISVKNDFFSQLVAAVCVRQTYIYLNHTDEFF